MSERWGHECIEGAIIRALAEAIRFVAGDQGDREHEAEALRQAVQHAKTEHDELRAQLTAALARATAHREALAGLVAVYGASRLPSGAATWTVRVVDSTGDTPPDALQRQNDAWTRALAALEDGT